MSRKLKVMFSTHGLVEGDWGFDTDEKGFPTSHVISKKVITGQDTGGQVYYVKALASNAEGYDVDLVTRRVDPRICPQFGGESKDLGKDINYSIEQQWHDTPLIRSRVLRVPSGGNFNFVPKEEIRTYLPELIDNLVKFYKQENQLQNIEVVEGHYRDGMMAAGMLCDKIEMETGNRPVMLVTSHSLGHKKYERNLPQFNKGVISFEEWKWHNFEQRIKDETAAFYKADIIVATSPDEETRLVAKPYLQDINKITVIPPGYNDQLFSPVSIQEKNKLKHQFEYKNLDGDIAHIDLMGKKVVSSLGRVVRDKGFSELSRSMVEIMKEDPSVIYLVSGEKGNPVTEECKEITKEFSDRVIFLPSLNQQEMAQVYKASTVFVMSSLNEAFGMVPIEAMGCKTAVIVGRSGFNDYAHCADIRDDKQDYSKAIGLYAPSQEEDRWRQVKALRLLLNNKDLCEKIAENGYRFASENLTWQKISQQKDHLVLNVLEGRKILQKKNLRMSNAVNSNMMHFLKSGNSYS